MEYSLCDLNEKTNLESLKTNEIINKLNLVGFEVDNVTFEQKKQNPFGLNIKLLLKIPANRDDLLLENYFIQDLSSLLLKEQYSFWKHVKYKYYPFLKAKYFEHILFHKKKLNDSFKGYTVYNIEILNSSKIINFDSPIWIQQKLQNNGIKIQNNLEDIINLVNFEWGHYYSILENNILVNDDSFKLNHSIPNLNSFIISCQNNIKQELQNSNFNLSNSFIIQGIFYDIHKNEYSLNGQQGLENKVLSRLFRKSFKENFRESFQRLLTLFELCYNLKVSNKLCLFSDEIELIKTKKILKLKKKSAKIFLNLDKFNLQIFEQANLKLVCSSIDSFYFQIPLVRNDLNREIDLIEEYTRFIGYKNFIEIYPLKEFSYYKPQDDHIKIIKEFFINYGFNEIITNPLVPNEKKRTEENSIFLTNPLNLELNILRYEFLSGLISVFESNLRLGLGLESKNYFEIGRTFENKNRKVFEMDKLGGIFQVKRFKKSEQSSTEWFIAKGLLENMLSHFGCFDFLASKEESSLSYFHSTKSVNIHQNNEIVGVFGEIDPKIQKTFNSKFGTYAFEINLKFLKNFKTNSKIRSYKEFSKYPLIVKDISILVKKEINLAKLQMDIKTLNKDIKAVKYFDLYFSEKNKNYINLGIRIEFQSFSKTLNTLEIEAQIEMIISFINRL